VSLQISRLKGSNRRSGKCVLSIVGELTIYTAAEAKQELLECLTEYSDFHLRLDEVEEIDSAGFQVLALFTREARGQGKRVVGDACSAAVEDILALYRQEELLMAVDAA